MAEFVVSFIVTGLVETIMGIKKIKIVSIDIAISVKWLDSTPPKLLSARHYNNDGAVQYLETQKIEHAIHRWIKINGPFAFY